MKKFLVIIYLLLVLVLILGAETNNGFKPVLTTPEPSPVTFWAVQSFDTTKYSRDMARDRNNDSSFNQLIDLQMQEISSTGATYVAIGTPYDEEFVPFLTRWVDAARKNNLKVWFRGNWSGWEGWFGYSEITEEEHIQKTENFIATHPQLFQKGDIFSACTECENGIQGNPVQNGTVDAYRNFLIDEYKATRLAFGKINKEVKANFAPMNADVARAVMDKSTTRLLGGTVVLDHYVADPAQYETDLKAIAKFSGGKIMLGEFGAPIASVHGDMTPDEQADWINEVLKRLVTMPEVVGVNYWGAVGGSTGLWNDQGQARPAVATVKSFYSPKIVSGEITDELGSPVDSALIKNTYSSISVSPSGKFSFPYLYQSDLKFFVSAPGYENATIQASENSLPVKITLNLITEDLLFKFKKLFH